MQYKDRRSPKLVMAISIHISLVVYATIPVFAAAVESYDRPTGHVATTTIVYVLVAVLVAFTVTDFRRASHGHWEQLHPWFSFVQLTLSVVIVLLVNVTAGGAYGTYHILFLLPIVIAAVMGDRAMIAATWAMCLIALGVSVWDESFHSVETVIWTVAISGAAWGGAAVAIHIAVQRFLESIHIGQAMAELATVAGDVDRWPEGLDACLPILRRALDADEVFIFAAPAGTPPSLVASSGSRGEAGTALEEGTRRALDLNDVVDAGTSTFIPRRTAAGLDIVVAATGRHLSVLQSADSATAVTVGQLVASIADRVSLIGGLRQQAVTDPLTGLSNRRGMHQTLDRMLAHAARSGESFSLAILDLDHFKDFNDTYGHLEGDRLLRTFGDELAVGIRRQDLAARYGGEEFCILLPTSGTEGALQVLYQLRARLHAASGTRGVTFSAGVATWDRSEEPTSLLSRADAALYRAKAAGRDAVEAAVEVTPSRSPGGGVSPGGTTAKG